MKDSGEEHKNKIKEEIITAASSQFAEYDHHNQKLFIQFFSAVFIVLIGYGFVFAKQPSLFEVSVKPEDQYSFKHLLAVYVVSQIILIFLSTLILNIGYTFRRDQLTLLNIRKYYFSDEEYEEIFGKLPNNPLGKKMLKDSFLPTFNALFYRFVIFIQCVLFASIVIVQEKSPEVIEFVSNHRYTYVYILSFAILINLSEYIRFYIKYKSKVDYTAGYELTGINFLFSCIQEGWATLVPLLLLVEFFLKEHWLKACIIIVEFISWGLLLVFLVYLLKLLKKEASMKKRS
ncbi:MAG TPA: hypothetical protein VF421_10765 [Niabella sp.]